MDISKTMRYLIRMSININKIQFLHSYRAFLKVKYKQPIVIIIFYPKSLPHTFSYLCNIWHIGVFDTVERSHTEHLPQNNHSISSPSFTVWFKSIFSLSILFPLSFYPFSSFSSRTSHVIISPISIFNHNTWTDQLFPLYRLHVSNWGPRCSLKGS